ncbi:MAG: hypothetical protein NSGCLCUN01_03987 [uncultured Clostridium sp.]
MDKKVLEKAVTKTVEYYFELSSYEEAINKVLEEIGEKRMFEDVIKLSELKNAEMLLVGKIL